jgi:hypothetical protein
MFFRCVARGTRLLNNSSFERFVSKHDFTSLKNSFPRTLRNQARLQNPRENCVASAAVEYERRKSSAEGTA